MQNIEHKAFGFSLMLLVIFFVLGCVSDPVKVDLSANHPANPEAQEAEFVPPPNPFQENASAMKAESIPDSMMKHKTHDESDQKQMHHDMGTKQSGHGQDDNQHKGHGQ
jgi:hypothetical protein